VHVCDSGIVEDGLTFPRDVLAAHHFARVVPDPVVVSVSPYDRRIKVVEPGRHRFTVIPVAGLCMKKNRSRFCVGMKSIEWPVRQYQLLVPFGDEFQTMAAWIRKAFRDSTESRLAIRIDATAPDSFTLVGRNSPDSQFHGFLLLAMTTLLRTEVEHLRQTLSTRFLRNLRRHAR
jgi:hypothetical protein